MQCSIECTNNQIHITLKEIDELDMVVDTLRSNKVSIRSIIPDRQSLEDYFVDVIGKDGGK